MACLLTSHSPTLGELRTARAQAARVDADASMPRGTAMRAARRAAEAADGGGGRAEEGCGGGGGRGGRAAAAMHLSSCCRPRCCCPLRVRDTRCPASAASASRKLRAGRGGVLRRWRCIVPPLAVHDHRVRLRHCARLRAAPPSQHACPALHAANRASVDAARRNG